MNTTRTLVLAALASIPTAAALANPLTGLLEWQVSADGGVTWGSSITINPDDSYRIRARTGWTTVPGTTDVGFNGCSFEQIDLIGADASDTFGGASGPGGVPNYIKRRQSVQETWTLEPGTGPSAGGLKLEGSGFSGRANLGQVPYRLTGGAPNPQFIFDNPAVMLDLAAVAGGAKTLIISATWTRLGATPTNQFTIYVTETGTSRKPVQEATMTDAHVWIRPNASCIPDFNGDGLVDFSDYLEFLNFYDTQDFRADLNHDSLVDFADYLEFLTAYDAGC